MLSLTASSTPRGPGGRDGPKVTQMPEAEPQQSGLLRPPPHCALPTLPPEMTAQGASGLQQTTCQAPAGGTSLPVFPGASGTF